MPKDTLESAIEAFEAYKDNVGLRIQTYQLLVQKLRRGGTTEIGEVIARLESMANYLINVSKDW